MVKKSVSCVRAHQRPKPPRPGRGRRLLGIGGEAVYGRRPIGRNRRLFRLSLVLVPGRFDVSLVPTDAKDNPIVACALEGDADYIVTDDRRDLLPLKVIRVAGHKAVQIVAPTAFLKSMLGPR